MKEPKTVRKAIEALPAIVINIDCPPKEFLERMSEIVRKSEDYELEAWPGGMKQVGINIFPKDDLGFIKLGGQLICIPDKNDQIRVETRANQWIPEDVTRDIYLQATHHIFDNLIKAYNSRYKKCHRMRVIKEKYRGLPPKATEALKDFTFLANKTSLHLLDWQRVYTFVRVCHATRVNPEKGLIRGMLSKEGFDDNKAEYIADIISHLLDFMKYK